MPDRRERLLATLRREGMQCVTGDILFTPPKLDEFTQRYGTLSSDEFANCYHRVANISYEAAHQFKAADFFPAGAIPDRFEIDPFGIGMSYGSEAAYHMCHFHAPLEGKEVTEKLLKAYKLPVIPAEERQRIQQFCHKTHEQGLAAVGFLSQTIWERSWLIRGMNDLMVEMHTEPELAELLFDRITDHAIEAVRLYAECGYDIIALGDDIGMQNSTMMSVEMWQRFLKPRLERVITEIKQIDEDILVFYHSCGYITPFIEGLIECGIDILNPIQPECMDIAEIKNTYGDRLSFWGGIGTQTTLPFGTPKEVRARVRELYELFKAEGGIVICPTHTIEPEVPWDNLEAYRDEILRLDGLLERSDKS